MRPDLCGLRASTQPLRPNRPQTNTSMDMAVARGNRNTVLSRIVGTTRSTTTTSGISRRKQSRCTFEATEPGQSVDENSRGHLTCSENDGSTDPTGTVYDRHSKLCMHVRKSNQQTRGALLETITCSCTNREFRCISP